MRHKLGDPKQGGWKDWLWMALCCIPMVAVVVLVALGVLSLG